MKYNDGMDPQEQTTMSFASDAMLDEESARLSHGRSKKKFLIGGLVLLACAAAVVAAVVVFKGSSSSASTANASSSNSSSTSSSSGSSTTSTTSTSGSSGNAKAKTYSDPTAETYSLVAYAIGDWGATTYSTNGSCCTRRKGVFNAYDLHAEQGVNKLMALEAASTTPQAVIGHGDNFYWTGINGDKDQSERFTYTFEERHSDASMNTVPWINVMGNHDYGGGDYICLDSSGNMIKCTTSNVGDGLEQKFQLQSAYKSPNNDRWKMPDHYYKYTIKQGDVSMDIFNLDMNDADTHGANEICCQCYSYANGDDTKCTTATRGDEYCCGGDTTMYDACVAKLTEWGDEALTELQKDVAASTATWKVVNSHYSPYAHNGVTKGTKWMDALKELSGIQLWIYGHTHGEKHDWASFDLHFIENGAGGGIQSESASGIPDYAKSTVSNIWTAPGLGDDGGSTYGFFKLEASASWMKASFITFGEGWTLSTTDATLSSGMVGKTKVGHCWYIPSDGAKGQTC